jgi:NAD(P)-dependent dehydrogenase (short-subunit alcohol dehydrogenase family)
VLLDNRVVLVTGIGPGLGRSLAMQCARHGAAVVLAARSREKLQEVAGEIEQLGRQALVVPTDVTDSEQVQHLVDRAVEGFGRLDGVINSAFEQPPMKHIEDTDMSEWLHAFDINCHAAIRVTKAAIPSLRQSRNAAVVFVATMSIWSSRPNFGAYAAAKSAIASAARTLAAELGPDGIRVNTIAPGYIWGDPVRGYLEAQAETRGVDPQVVHDELLAQIPLRRVNTPDEIAGAGVFMLSDLARGVTGALLDVNGGQTMR